MTAIECHEFVNRYYPDPIFTEWQPSEYDMKYHYNTPRRLKKLASQKAKEDAKLKIIFDKEVEAKANVHRIIDNIATYPESISDLFLKTFKWTIEDLIRRHEKFMEEKNKMISTYGEDVVRHLSDVKYLAYTTKWEANWSGRGGRRVEVKVNVTPEMWQKFVERHTTWVNDSYIKVFSDITDYERFLTDYDVYKSAREDDDIISCDGNAYIRSITHMADVLDRICYDITQVFNGNKPTACETDAHWGCDGKFNGILTDGTTRASFKSFGAGGWNIVRFHYRFKITKLKN